MIKTRLIKVKSIRNWRIIMAMTMTEIITAVIMKIIIIMMTVRIKIGRDIKI